LFIRHLLARIKPIFYQEKFAQANSKNVGTDPTFSQPIFSLTNHITKVCLSVRAKKFAYIVAMKMGFMEWFAVGTVQFFIV
jgi:hypothetical protein